MDEQIDNDNDYGDQDFEDEEQPPEPVTKGEDVAGAGSPTAPSAPTNEQAPQEEQPVSPPAADNVVDTPAAPIAAQAEEVPQDATQETQPIANSPPVAEQSVAPSAAPAVEKSPVASDKDATQETQPIANSPPVEEHSVAPSTPPAVEKSPVASNKATGKKQKGQFPPLASPSKSKASLSNSKDKMSKSLPELGSFDDLRQKTEFSMTTTGGVQPITFQHSTSNFRTGPKYSMGARGPTTFVRGTNIPAAGTYNMPAEDKTKYQRSPQFSWGCSSRWGMGVSPQKLEPGPGAYNPSDPTLFMETKIGFGTELRGKETMLPQAKPGPGAYEYRSCIGKGLMYSARGRFQPAIARARSQPGPGAYNPSSHSVKLAAPKCGFGTSIRDDPIAQAKGSLGPGPGTYELQQHRAVGSEAPKYSATSRRRVHDLNSYVTPGPGSYNSHTTSFEPAPQQSNFR